MYDVLECDTRETVLGEAMYVRIHRDDMAPMGFRELWDLFAERYPGKWAVQVFPDAKNLLDQANKYHLFVIDKPPAGLNLMDPPMKRRLLV